MQGTEEKVYFLKDLAEDSVDAVVIATTTTQEELQEAIYKVKSNDEYSWEDLIAGLPKDCKVYDRWGSRMVYY